MSCALVLRRLKLSSVVFGKHISCRYAKKYCQVDLKLNKYTQVYRDLHGSIGDETIAKDFVFALDKKERQFLLNELQRFKTEQLLKKGGDHCPETGLTRVQKWTLFFHHAVPFMVFGFMDNFIMIVCGEYIELYFGAMFGISTMAAAGMGNLVSDVIGIGSGAYVEKLLNKFGFRAPALTPEQADLTKTRLISNLGRMIGIAVGCALGMLPLLWFDT